MTADDVDKAIDAAFLAEVSRLYAVLAEANANHEGGGRDRFLKGLVNAMEASRQAKAAAATFRDYP